MRPPKLEVSQIKELGDPIYRYTVPANWADNNGHVNVRWYAVLYDDAGDVLHDMHALTVESHKARNSGTMDLQHHTFFVSEIMPGEALAVYVRALEVNAKRLHYLMFTVNETKNQVSNIFECINTFVDLNIRKTAPWPPEARQLMQEMIAAHSVCTWPAPVSGAMSV